MTDKREVSATRVALLQQWMRDHERGPVWVARRLGYSREYISDVLRGRFRFTDKLARGCTVHLGMTFGYVGPEDAEAEGEPAGVVREGAPVSGRR
jgi:hypothetical protein